MKKCQQYFQHCYFFHVLKMLYEYINEIEVVKWLEICLSDEFRKDFSENFARAVFIDEHTFFIKNTAMDTYMLNMNLTTEQLN